MQSSSEVQESKAIGFQEWGLAVDLFMEATEFIALAYPQPHQNSIILIYHTDHD